MYLNLHCLITIGDIQIHQVNQVTIRETWKLLTDTADIVLPRNLTYKNKQIKETINRGDQVTIQLGYNNELFTEFQGYVSEVEPNVPLRITCEDEMFLLKKGSIKKSWPKVSLKELVEFVAPGYEVISPDVNLGKFEIKNASPAKVLDFIRTTYGIHSFFKGKVLHTGFAYTHSFDSHQYHFQKNIRDNNLKYRFKDQYKIKVKAISNLANGKKEIVELGDDDGDLRTLNFGPMTKTELEQIATGEMNRFNFSGYRNDITGFGAPRTRHGDQVELIDAVYPERTSTNIIDAVTIRFGEVYFERINELGPKVD